ncbi:MAG: hypothetical protein HKN33_02840 [Pyrinomonadaceae bacterium]|nr:hypothetical protein [Pyrinomonadaceae bacterium]
MTEALAGAMQQLIQEASKQSVSGNTAHQNNNKTFESHMRQDSDGDSQKVTGNEMREKLDALQQDLADKLSAGRKQTPDPDQVPAELLDTKTRLGLLREAYTSLEASGKAGSFENRFLQVENEYKQVEAIMRSDNNLSPGELLALQARLYQVSQHIEVMSKVVDQMAGGIKTVLNTNV